MRPSRGRGATGETRRFRSFAGLRSDRRVRAIAVIRRCDTDGAGREQRGGPCYSRYDRVGTTVRRGSQVSPTPDSTLDDPEQLTADLQRQLAECRAERDEALEQQTATAGYCRSSTARPASSRRRSRRCSTRRCSTRRYGSATAVLGAFWIIDGEHGRLGAAQGLPAEFVELARVRGLIGTNPALQQSANRLFSALVKIAACGRGFAGRR
jgi:hypothetical protein